MGNLPYIKCQKLPFLAAVIKEAMRLNPSITFQLLRYVPPSGLVVDDKLIPPGYPVGISPLAQNRDVAIWGKDADEFRPERWLDPNRSRHLDANDMIFGGNGPRMCIGRNIALVGAVGVRIYFMLMRLDYRWRSSSRSRRLSDLWISRLSIHRILGGWRLTGSPISMISSSSHKFAVR